jgi:ubiquinone biosynthesis monooxygenase Coq7
MSARKLTLADRVIGEIDRAINVLWATPRAHRPPPGAPAGDSAAGNSAAGDPAAGEPAAGGAALSERARAEAARLMRVNHAGEVAAQALYRGQALTAREPGTARSMRQAAAEEMDHLAWCDERLKQLNGRSSLLNPLWYAGSFFIGSVAGILGDRASLGFIAETERQVESHLRGHLDRLPPEDRRSRAILQQMTHDEIQHGVNAAALGGKDLPLWLKGAMRLTSKLMTRGSYWL